MNEDNVSDGKKTVRVSESMKKHIPPGIKS